MVALSFNPNTLDGRGRPNSEFLDSQAIQKKKTCFETKQNKKAKHRTSVNAEVVLKKI